MQEWIVPAVVTRIIDGDTIEVTLDLGWKLYKNDHVRFAGINAPEMKTPEGIAARDFLCTYLQAGQKVMIHSRKLDKYGRCLATVITITGLNLNNLMVKQGHAVEYMV
jgi:micrococcal nuclease